MRQRAHLAYIVTLSFILALAFGPALLAQSGNEYTEWQITEQTDTRIVMEREVIEPPPEPTATHTAEPEPTSTSTPIPPTATPEPTTVPDLSGQVCPASVHDQYKVTGKDGNQYHGWHPMVDDATGCHFGHEHGNDPESVVPGAEAVYGYAGGESHHGFKTYAFHDHLTGLDWIISQHQGTTTRNALCGRFHEIQVLVYEDGVKQADLHIMGDFGQSRYADTNQAMTPPECPDNPDISSQGLRRIPETGDGYGPYNVNGKFPELGLRIHAQFLTTDGRTACPDSTCAELTVNEENTGSRRRFQVLDKGLSINVTETTANSGLFVDSMGVEQYIAPGFSADLLVAKHNRDSAKRNGMWSYGGEFAPMEAATDNGNFNGADPLMPLDYFVEN